MKNRTKVCPMLVSMLTVFALAIFLLTACSSESDSAKYGSGRYVTNSYELSEEFDKIMINVDTADTVFLPSEDGKNRVVCYEKKSENHAVSVQDGCLNISVNLHKKWYDYISIGFNSPKITVYLARNDFESLVYKVDTGDLKIENFNFGSIDVDVSTAFVALKNTTCAGDVSIDVSTGDIEIEGMSCKSFASKGGTGNLTVQGLSADGEISLRRSTGDMVATNLNSTDEIYVKVTTGDVRLTNLTCKDFASDGGTGKLSMSQVIASESFNITRSTGNINFDGCDASEIYVATSTGNVRGTLLTDKVYIVRNNAGKIDVPKTITGGRCEITTETGDIEISVNN